MTNMGYEAFLGFNAFNTKKITGADVIDFVKMRQTIAEGKPMTMETYAEILAKPQG
jgi:6-oxo-cyclohex-1-ene-carbonyl-CoA hydrolase